jgi:hypothetical protein
LQTMVTQALTSKSDSAQRHGYFLVTMALKIKMKKSLISKINTPPADYILKSKGGLPQAHRLRKLICKSCMESHRQ